MADADGRGRTSLRSDNTVLHVTAETCPDNATHSVSHTGDLISDDVTVMNDVSYGEVICPPPFPPWLMAVGCNIPYCQLSHAFEVMMHIYLGLPGGGT